MTVYSIPEDLGHLEPLIRAIEARALKQAALWCEDSRLTMDFDSPEWRWATGARHFLWQMADERAGVAPWSTDMHTAITWGTPVMVGRRGSSLMAMAIYTGLMWRHAESLTKLCFDPDVWQPLPKPPS